MNILKPPDIQKAIENKDSKQIIKAYRWFPKLHSQAIEALGVIADKSCIEQLEAIVKYSSSIEYTQTAIKALSRINGPATGNILVRFAYYSTMDVQSRVLALNSINPRHKPTELDTLIKCGSEADLGLRTAAIKALLRIDSE
jgi:HEAT repeat protein